MEKPHIRHIVKTILLSSVLLLSGIKLPGQSTSDNKLVYEQIGEIPNKLGVAGPFTGLLGANQDILMVAGGANFAPPVWEAEKEYHEDIFLGKLINDNSELQWLPNKITLPNAMAYGASVSYNGIVICLGGHNSDKVFDKVFAIKFNDSEEEISLIDLPQMPSTATHGCASIIGDFVYFFGGQSGHKLESSTNSLWRLNISEVQSYLNSPSGSYPYDWEILPPLPGPTRAVHSMAAQHNGRNPALYIIGGRRIKNNYSGSKPFELLSDVWEYDPMDSETPWTRKADAPVNMMAGPASQFGQSHIFILGGTDGKLIYLADSLRDEHPGFPKKAWSYHTITDTWTTLGKIPSNQVTTTALRLGDKIIIPSGEVRPRVRSNKVWAVSIPVQESKFGWLNYTTLVVYLFAMLLVGVYFTRRNKNTNDFFRGGQRIPWWAAACSIFATMLSSLTYMSVPAKAYMTNWEYLLGYPLIFLTAILVIYLILPFFRQIDATSAYEYLDKRFNRGARYLGSGFFVLFQIGRMAIVMFLSALALTAITPFTPAQCILIMGLLSIIYCTLGGVEAVIWTDTIQTFVLLGGAILIFILVLLKLDGGVSEFVNVAAADDKFKMVNWDWDIFSYTTAAFWVIIIGAFGQNLVSYGSDQAVIQRYMTTSDQKKAAKSILTNGIISVPAGLLFFAVGTALYVFYKSHPSGIDPNFQNDAIMPLFIVQEIPAGLAGLIIAGVFAAAQSTISTSMNSIATTTVTDFVRPWNILKSEEAYLKSARILTVIFGILGTALALIFASADIKSLLDQFFAVLGLFGGALGGMFLLGMFTRRARGRGAVGGAIIGAISLYFVSTFTATHVYLYAAIGIVVTMISGWLLSLVIPDIDKDIKGLTVYDLKKENLSKPDNMEKLRIKELQKIYKEGLLNDTLPFWINRCVDKEHGGFTFMLNRDGSLMDTDKGVWQQGRFTWMMATLYNKWDKKKEWLDLAKHGIDFIENKCFDSDGRMFFHVSKNGTPIRKRRYIFSETFAAIAYAAYSKASGEEWAANKAHDLWKMIMHYLHTPGLLPPKFTSERQSKGLAIPMTLLVTAQELRQNIGDKGFTETINTLMERIKLHWMKPEFSAVLETVGMNGEFIDHFDGRMLNPGHSIELAWFLMRESEYRNNDPEILEMALTILDWMWEWGWDKEYGGITYYKDVKNYPPQEYWHDMKFWWPQNEAIIATLMAYRLSGDEKYSEWHQMIHDWTYKHFPDPEYGEWYGYLHRDGRISIPSKGNLWKGPFHLPRMQMVCADECGKML